MDGYTTQSWANNCTTATAPNLDELVQTVTRMKAERERINAQLLDALNRHIDASGVSVYGWASRFGVDAATLSAYLAGKREPDGYFWDQVRRVFEPMRTTAKEMATNG